MRSFLLLLCSLREPFGKYTGRGGGLEAALSMDQHALLCALRGKAKVGGCSAVSSCPSTSPHASQPRFSEVGEHSFLPFLIATWKGRKLEGPAGRETWGVLHGDLWRRNTSPDIILSRASLFVCSRSSVNERQGQSSCRSADIILLSVLLVFFAPTSCFLRVSFSFPSSRLLRPSLSPGRHIIPA